MSKKILISFTVILTLAAVSLVSWWLFNKPQAQPVYTQAGTPVGKDIANVIETRKPVVTYTNPDMVGAVKSIPGLKNALTNYDTRPCRQYTEGSYKVYILAVSSDKSQVLIGHGCGSQGYVRSIFIRQKGSWRKVGAPHFIYRNQDNQVKFSYDLDIPSCKTVEKYDISIDISPVCYNGTPSLPVYQLRST